MAIKIGKPNIITNGLLLHIDPSNYNSYPRTGTHVTDLTYPTGWDFGGTTVSYSASDKTFNYSNDANAKYIVTDNSFAIADTSGMTYDFWCKLDTSSGYPSLFYDVGQGASPFVWIYESAGAIGIQYSYGASYNVISVSGLTTGVMRNIVITMVYGAAGNTEAKFYFDGVLTYSNKPGLLSKFPVGNSTKYIGDYGTAAGHNWMGKIGPVKIYNRVLSDAEVKRNYNACKKTVLTTNLFGGISTSGMKVTGGIVRNGLRLYLDAGSRNSNPRTGINWYDISGYKNHGFLVSGATWSTSFYGNLQLSGTTDYAMAPITLGTDATFEIWAKITDYASHVLFGVGSDNYPSGDYGYGPDIYCPDSANWYWNTGDGTGNPFTGGTFSLDTTKWYQIVVTNQATSNAKIYINGVPNGTAAYRNATTTRSGCRFILGRWVGDSNYNTPGNFGIARVYNRALSSSEVLQNYNATKSRYN